MAGNPKKSAWYATPQEARTRKMVAVTLSDAARERLEKLARKRSMSKSELVETLIMEASLSSAGRKA